jgi:hypothetical protein
LPNQSLVLQHLQERAPFEPKLVWNVKELDNAINRCHIFELYVHPLANPKTWQ